MSNQNTNDYNKFRDELLKITKNSAESIIEKGKILNKAKKKLNTDQWKRLLSEKDLGIQKSQAYKYISVAKFCENNKILTKYLARNGVEKTDALAKIEDIATAEQLSEDIYDEDFKTKDIKELVKFTIDGLSIDDAIAKLNREKAEKKENTSNKAISPESLVVAVDQLYVEVKQIETNDPNLKKQREELLESIKETIKDLTELVDFRNEMNDSINKLKDAIESFKTDNEVEDDDDEYDESEEEEYDEEVEDDNNDEEEYDDGDDE